MVRRQAPYLCCLDERILEYLDGKSYAVPEEIVAVRNIEASPARVRERLRWLGSIDFVHFIRGEGSNVVEITTDGKLYLKGEIDSRLRQPSKDALRGE